MNMHEFLKALPKVSLHVHLMGSVQARTAVDLCNKHGVPLPDYEEPEDLYDYPDIYKFLHLYDNTALAVRDREDFHRIAYETLTEAAENNVRYREMFFNPTTHMAAGASYETCVDGLIDGIRDARTDHGIDCKLIAAVNRMETPELAVTMVETLAEHPRDDVIGIGMDYAEAEFPPERFWKAYRMADAARAAPDRPPERGRAAPQHRDLPRPPRLRAGRSRLPRDRERRGLQPLSRRRRASSPARRCRRRGCTSGPTTASTRFARWRNVA